MYKIWYSKKSIKFLENAPKELASRIIKKIEELQIQPFIHDTKVVQGFQEKLYRVRVGNYRILYEVDHTSQQIEIVKIEKRAKVYD